MAAKIDKKGTKMISPHKLDSIPPRDDEERTDFAEGLVTIQDPTGAASEAYRMLRTNLSYAYALVDTPLKIIVLTSADPGEGKSTTTANLGVALTQAGKSTLILDCDLRRPTLHRFFGTRNVRGLVDILVDEKKPEDVWQEPMPGLKLITPGPQPPNPAELLSSRHLTEFLGRLRQQFEYILVDTPPIGRVSDAAVLAANGDGVLLVLDSQNTRKKSLRQSLRTLEGVGANVLGTVMNNHEAHKNGHYSSYSY